MSSVNFATLAITSSTQPNGLMVAIGFLLAGVVMLLLGGRWLVNGATALARGAGISELLVGLTIVALGTSAPELAFNLFAALSNPGGTSLALGNTLGSNIANIGLVLGIGCLIKPVADSTAAVRSLIAPPLTRSRDYPYLIAATVLLLLLMRLPLDVSGADGTESELSRQDGWILLLGAVSILGLWIWRSLKAPSEVKARELKKSKRSTLRAIWVTACGLAVLLLGAHLAQYGAIQIAHISGMSELTIGLTIVAVSTSLPELLVVVVAARAGRTALVMGTVVGSNLINTLLVLGATATVEPIPTPDSDFMMALVMCVFTGSLLCIYLPRHRLGMRWGTVLISGWLATMLWSLLAS